MKGIFDLDNWQEIWLTITRNKLRSFLTGFGVFWGIFMLILLIGAGNALEGGIYKNVSGYAPNSCFFWSDPTSVPYKGFRKGRSWNMTTHDMQLIRERAQTVQYISPVLFGAKSDKNIVRGMKSGGYSIKGVYSEQFKMETPRILYGRVINDLDVDGKRKVCVLGEEVYETLYAPNENPIGSYVRINGIYFQVVGVIASTSNISVGGRTSRCVYLPLSTMQNTFSKGDEIHFVGCVAKPGYPASVVEDEVKSIIKAAHDISPDDQKAIGSFNMEKQFQIFESLFLGVDILIWIVGLGALFSGIVGISNIMLVTVRERTREIGVRRAIGAKPASIVSQILSESFILTAIAGFSGFLVGVSVLEIVHYVMTMDVSEDTIFIPPFVSFDTAMVSMLILIVSGIAAGLMPAMRALSIKAIDAIRDE